MKDDSALRARLSAQTGLDLSGDSKAKVVRPITKAMPEGIQWAPEGIDPHAMPVTDIVFDPAMVEHFPDLSPRSRRPASDHLFAAYKSHGRNKDRNSLLHRRIGEFLAGVHKSRSESGGFVKEKIRLANTLAEHNVTDDDLAEFLQWKESQSTQG